MLSIREPVLADRAMMQQNLAAIRSAIERQRKLAFIFNGYDRSKRLIPTREDKHTVNPYYIVANSGRYYLVGGWDASGERKARMCIYRIDLMSEIEVIKQKRLSKTEVEGLPGEWDDSFALKHLNMFYDSPERVRLKITCEPAQWTFLHDWFGDSFQPVGRDEVTVSCSPGAMVFWALQYCDRVEVLSPEHVRQKVAEKVQGLKEKYGV